MSQSPYSQVGPRLVQLGYSAIPIAPGSKAPGDWLGGVRWKKLDEWTLFCLKPPGEVTVQKWSMWPEAGVGICMGPASGLVAVDFDTRPELWPALEAAIPESPVKKRGEKGYTAFYRYSGEKLKRFTKPGDPKPTVEILSTGGQTVIPPTIHPDTKRPYRWDGPSLLDVPLAELPTLPADVVAIFSEIVGVSYRPPETSQHFAEDWDHPSVEWVADMLKSISVAVGADAWYRVGSSIKSLYPDDRGFELWRAWSATDKREVTPGVPQYQPRRMAKDWEKLDPKTRNVTPGTIFGLARDAGYKNWHFDQEKLLEGVSAELHPRVPTVITPTGVTRPKFTLSTDVCMRAPGLVGAITRWMVETSQQPQPVLALAAALAAVGALKAHRVRTETDLRTNIYVLGLAESGSGKRYPIDAIRVLFREAGVDHLLGKEPASAEGLCQMLREGDGVCVIMWDEIGHAISVMCDKNTGAHYSQIMSTVTNLFTEAASFHDGKALAAGSRENIEQPCLCICGMTVEERLFENLTKENASDGFLPRWLVFEVDTHNPKLQQEAVGLRSVPNHIINEITDIAGCGRFGGWKKRCPENEQRRIDEGRKPLDTKIYDPRYVPYTVEARAAYWRWRQEFADKAQEVSSQGRAARAIWNRAAEHIARIALIVSGYEETGMLEMNWAREVVVSRCEALCDAVSRRIGQNEKERNTKRVYELIRECDNGILRSVLTRKTQWLNTQERASILQTLKDSDQIREVSIPAEGEGSGRPGVLYISLE